MLGPDVVHLEDGKFRLDVPPARAAEINRTLVNAGVDVTELRSSERSLEDIFLQLTGDEPEAGGTEAGGSEAERSAREAATLTSTPPAAGEDKS
jgi:hypothetical protein